MKNRTKLFLGIFIIVSLMFGIILQENVGASGGDGIPDSVGGYFCSNLQNVDTYFKGYTCHDDITKTTIIMVRDVGGKIGQIFEYTASKNGKTYSCVTGRICKDNNGNYVSCCGNSLTDYCCKETTDGTNQPVGTTPVTPAPTTPVTPTIPATPGQTVTPVQTLKDVPTSMLSKLEDAFLTICTSTNTQINNLKNQQNAFDALDDKLGKLSPTGTLKDLKNTDADSYKTLINLGLKDENTISQSIKSIADKQTEIKNRIEEVRQESGFRKTRLMEDLVSVASCAYGIVAGGTLAKGSGTCNTEQAYSGITECEKCSAYEPYMKCTVERCNILGNCRTENKEDGTGIMCLPAECPEGEANVPHVNGIRLEWYQGRIISNGSDPASATGYINSDHYVKTTNVSYLVDTLNLTITTRNQRAKCKYSFSNGTDFKDMTMNFDNNWQYLSTQSVMIDLTGLPLGRTHTIYIKCESTCGAYNEKSDDSQYVKFTFDPRPDRLPPEIIRVVPDDKTQYLNHANNNATIEVWLNENGNCRYSTIAETGRGSNLTSNWTNMVAFNLTNNVWNIRNISLTNCTDNLPCGYINELGIYTDYNTTIYGNLNRCTRCYMNINMSYGYETVDWDLLFNDAQVLSQQETQLKELIQMYGLNTMGFTGQSKMFHYMFRCEDDSPQHNLMPEEETYDYMIFTYPPFNMTIVDPESPPKSYSMIVPVFVNTTRDTICKYVVTNQTYNANLIKWENMSFIDGENYGVEHRTLIENFTRLGYGLKLMHVRCRDYGGLEVYNNKLFNVTKDTTSPVIIRMYHKASDDSLLIETDELSQCVFTQDSKKGCSYNFSQGNAFMSVDALLHSYYWMPSIVYYVKCKDRWNNYPGGSETADICTAKINPFDIPTI